MKIGFTGTREGMTFEQKRSLASILSWYASHENAKEFHHGNCVGADEEAARIADSYQYVTVSHPSTLIEYDSRYESDVTLLRKPPLKRNQDIVRECEIVIATPKERTEPAPLRGQGTWSTVRYARKRDVKCIIIWPDGVCDNAYDLVYTHNKGKI